MKPSTLCSQRELTNSPSHKKSSRAVVCTLLLPPILSVPTLFPLPIMSKCFLLPLTSDLLRSTVSTKKHVSPKALHGWSFADSACRWPVHQALLSITDSWFPLRPPASGFLQHLSPNWVLVPLLFWYTDWGNVFNSQILNSLISHIWINQY